MTPIALRLTRFGVYDEPVEFRFPTGPGLYFLTGRNVKQPRLGANATGKTTLFNALTWACYDKTIEGLSAGDVCSWGHKGGTTVELDYCSRGTSHLTLARTWGPNSCTLTDHYEGITDTDWQPVRNIVKDGNAPLMAHLGLSYASWSHCVFLASGRPMFLDLKPEAKSQLISDILGLDQWDQRASRAGDRASAEDAQVRTLESELAEVLGALRTSQQASVKQDREAWARNRDADLASIERRHAEGVQARRKAETALQDATDLLRASRADRAAALAKVDELKAVQDKASKLWQEARQVLDTFDAELRAMTAAGHLHTGDVCPTCKQNMTPAGLARLRSDVSKLKQAREEAQVPLQEVEQAMEEHRARMAQADLDAKRAGDIVWEDEQAERDARRALQRLDQDLDRLEEEAEALQKAVNPFDRLHQEERQRTGGLQEQADDLENRLQAARERRELARAWVTGFKEVRLQQMDAALVQLEVEVNSRCVELGLEGWSLEFTTDRATKKGTVTKGFTVTVRSPEAGNRSVPWASWCGGEKQRLRLAGTMGLADLCRARTGATIPLEVWDEPSQGLSPQGLVDLLDCLRARAHREQRQIWVVDHHSLGYGAFDGTATAIHDDAGTVIQQSWRIDGHPQP